MADVLITLSLATGASIRYYNDRGWTSIRCPFHEDRTPSASINTSTDRFKCHVCDVGGDIIDVVKQHKGMETGEAIEWIKNVFKL